MRSSLCGFVQNVWDGKRGVIGRGNGKIKDLAAFFGMPVVPLPAYEAIVNHDFTPRCHDAARI
jgi:hypothetical protein